MHHEVDEVRIPGFACDVHPPIPIHIVPGDDHRLDELVVATLDRFREGGVFRAQVLGSKLGDARDY
jgi:hypothetical protein